MLKYPYAESSKTHNGITFTIHNDGSVTVNGTSTGTAALSLIIYNAEIKNGNYTAKLTNGISGNVYLYIGGGNSGISGSGNVFKNIEVTNNTFGNFLIQIPNGKTFNNLTVYPMLVKGTYTEQTMPEFEKYTGGIASPNPSYEQPILSSGDNGTINENISNKNLFDKDKAKNVDYYIEPTTGSKVTQMGCMMSDFILVKENTSYVRNKKNDSNGNTFFASLIFCDKNKNYISGLWFSDNTFTTPAGTRYINLFSTRNRTNNENEEFVQDFMVEPGTTATPYVPHEDQDYSIFVQQPFRSIGDVRDLFFKNVKDSEYYDKDLEENKWYERHNIARYICKGNEVLLNQTELNTVSRWVIQMTGAKIGSALSNYYTYYANYTANTEHFYVAGNQILTFHNKTIKSGTQYLQYFAEKYENGNPVYFDYQLAIPLDLPCTPEQIQQLENKPSTYKDFTIIQSQDETPAYLEVSGIYDLNKLVNN